MKLFKLILAITLTATALLIACGGEKSGGIAAFDNFLPREIPGIDMKRVSDIRTYDNKTLWEYIDGGAELYLLYNFKAVATADYKMADVEIVADVYQFDSPVDAYGLYSMFRAPDVEVIRLGVEGFLAPASLNFVKGDYLVRLTGYDESPESGLAIVNLAEEINKLIPGTTEPPASFNAFPADGIVALTDKYYAESFLGHKFMTCVFCRDYLLDGDSLTLFLADDPMADKYIRWSELAERIRKRIDVTADLPFDEDRSFIFDDSFHGNVIAGLRKGKLVGMTNYGKKHEIFLVNWLNSLK
ncbi:MAG: hypothetical protein JSU69_04515 [Candidatus Zixiibacteriota bacterium]|nr:MAG: hypothetical protein JSU69_04515 [candidate division Zixibacteria bacterium]